MTNRQFVLSIFREKGRADALDLRGRAQSMTGTAVIAEEAKIPVWDRARDYSAWPAGAPVSYNGNVFGLLQPHNAAYYPASTPENTPALWAVKHTTDPEKAKPWLAPNGTSGLYMADECCVFGGRVWRCIHDDNPYSPEDYADWWEAVL